MHTIKLVLYLISARLSRDRVLASLCLQEQHLYQSSMSAIYAGLAVQLSPLRAPSRVPPEAGEDEWLQ